MLTRLARPTVRISSYFVPVLCATVVQAQVPDTARSIARLDAALLAARGALATELWPGFEVERIGLLYLLPGTGKLLARWPGSEAPGAPVDGGRRWTTAPVAWEPADPVQVVPVDSGSDRAQVLGLALHEAFHVHQAHFAGEGAVSRRENAMLLPGYPVFDAENEARAAVEGEALRAAVEATSREEARRHAAEFLALRRARHARLPEEIVEFERAGEVHEGIAQYVQLRGLEVLAGRDPSLRPGLEREQRAEREVLSGILAGSDRSVRRRLYATGSQMGFLLDRLAGPEWKERITREPVWLEELVAGAVGAAPVDSAALARRVEARLLAAVQAVARREADRTRRRAALLEAPGAQVVLSPAALAADRFDWCGFDPQNLLPDGEGNLLHTRMLRVCSEGRTLAVFDQPVVESRLTGALHARVSSPVLTAGGAALPLPAPGESLRLEQVVLAAETLSLTAAAALVIGTAGGVLVIPLR